MEKYKNMTGSQLWDVLVGDQTCEEFMNYKPSQTVEDAVAEYISNENLREMFGEWENMDTPTLSYIRGEMVKFIGEMLAQV